MHLLLLLSLLFQTETYLIQSIHIEGNESTDTDVITRHILFEAGDRVTKEQIIESQKRIESLSIFNSVRHKLEKTTFSYKLTYQVSERLNIFVIPIYRLTDGRFDRATYGLSLNHSNFLGRNQKLILQTLFGYQTGFRLGYINPWVLGKLRLSYALNFVNVNNTNVLDQNVENPTRSFGVSVGKGFGPFFRIAANLNYTNILFNTEDIVYSNSNSRSDKQMNYSLTFSYDNRDYRKYPTQGMRLEAGLSLINYISSASGSFYRWDMKYKFFHSYDRFTFGHSISHGKIWENPIYYNQYSFGDSRVIRGHNFPRSFSNNIALSTHEIRYKFIDDKFVSVNPPLLGKFTQKMRISSFIYSFIETGVLFEHTADISYDRMKTGYGLGVALITPYLAYISLEYAQNAVGYSEIALSFKAGL